MAGLYSTELKTQYFDPRVDISNSICELQLDPNTAYYPNLKLAGLHATQSAKHPYALMSGAYGLIKAIHLMDGRVRLDSLRRANRYLAWKNLNNTNDENISKRGREAKHELGFLIYDDNRIRTAGGGDVGSGLYTNQCQPVADHTEQFEALLDLRECFPLLNNISYLDTSVFKNLKVVIEWETDVQKVVTRSDTTIASGRPTLVADEIRDPQVVNNLRKNLKAVVWNAIESDQFLVPAANAGNNQGANATAKQETSQVVSGFDNKFVERIVMMKNFTVKTNNVDTNNVIGYGDYASYNQLDGVEQFRVNGRNVFPSNGIDSPSLRAMICAQAWGDLNYPPSGNLQNIGLDNPNVASVNTEGQLVTSGTKVSRNVGMFDYTGFRLNERINHLNVSLSRSNIDSAGDVAQNNLGLTCFMFAEVRKGLQIEGFEYQVKYL